MTSLCSEQNVKELFQSLKTNHPELFENTIVHNFFLNPNHIKLLCYSLLTDSTTELDKAFRKFYFGIRFIRYINSLIKFATIDLVRKNNRDAQRTILIFDKPLEGSVCFGEYLINTHSDFHQNKTEWDQDNFIESIQHEDLYSALLSLTEKQKLVITLTYSTCSSDIEIASKLSVTQQAVSKTRISALKKLKKALSQINTNAMKGVI